jgi:drug/metabolite transporter (DMT)-like permease
MNFDRRAIAALTASGILWGCTMPATKLASQWLPPAWLSTMRFGIAAAILLVVCRRRIRAACSPAILASGAIGYGGTIIVQNAGVMRTSVTHAALLVGTTPVFVALIAAIALRTVARPAAWAGYGVSVLGVCLVAGAGAQGDASLTGDGLILLSLLMCSAFTVAQARLLPGRDAIAVTAVQFLGATLISAPVALLTEPLPTAAGAGTGLPVVIGLALLGTLAPFTLFAFAQSRVPATTAAGFLNLEPLVGAAVGVIAFGDPFGLLQLAGGAAIIAGIAVSGRAAPARRIPRRATRAAARPVVSAEPAALPTEPAVLAAEPAALSAGPASLDPHERLSPAHARQPVAARSSRRARAAARARVRQSRRPVTPPERLSSPRAGLWAAQRSLARHTR